MNSDSTELAAALAVFGEAVAASVEPTTATPDKKVGSPALTAETSSAVAIAEMIASFDQAAWAAAVSECEGKTYWQLDDEIEASVWGDRDVARRAALTEAEFQTSFVQFRARERAMRDLYKTVPKEEIDEYLERVRRESQERLDALPKERIAKIASLISKQKIRPEIGQKRPTDSVSDFVSLMRKLNASKQKLSEIEVVRLARYWNSDNRVKYAEAYREALREVSQAWELMSELEAFHDALLTVKDG